MEIMFEQVCKMIEGKTLLTRDRCLIIYNALKAVKNLDGDVAEIGVYKGGIGKLMATIIPDKLVYLFDTFEGIPEVTEGIDAHKVGEFSESVLDVTAYLKDNKNVRIIKGVFPESTVINKIHREYCFVHLDVDMYKSTLNALNYLYPRLVVGGIIVGDDYGWYGCPGVTKAFNEFFEGKKETIISTTKMQCMVVKE